MILKLRVECIFGVYLKDECVRVIAMDDSASLYDLHEVIQEAVSFYRDHPYEFFIANSGSPRARRDWITYREQWEEKEADFRSTHLKDIWPLGRKRLYYWFDFGDRWIFEIRKMRTSSKAEGPTSSPRVLESIGPDPEQYPRVEE